MSSPLESGPGRRPAVISPCQSPHEKTLFERLPEILHGSDPAFVPPFPGSIKKYLSPASAFQRRHGQLFPLIAWRNGRPCGAVAAIVNHSHNTYHRDRTGFFGFFACEDDVGTAAALFDHAAKILRDNGCHAIRGPYNPSINDECGLLVRGFEHAPYMGLTWNPAYYSGLLDQAGFACVRTMYGFHLPLDRLEIPERWSRLAAHVAKRSRIRLRPINLRNLAADLEVVHEVYNATLERNWGFVPISMDDLLEAANDMKAIADPGMIQIAERDGRRAGVALSLPNFNEILALTKRTPRWLRLLHVAWLMKTHRMQGVRLVVYGISPRFRDKGLHAWLLHEQFSAAKAGYANAELGWIEESNTEILENSRAAGGVQHKLWKIFEKPL